jgi:hypothetical protein
MSVVKIAIGALHWARVGKTEEPRSRRGAGATRRVQVKGRAFHNHQSGAAFRAIWD